MEHSNTIKDFPPKIRRRKKIIKIKAKINEKEMKETVGNLNKNESWFFEKT